MSFLNLRDRTTALADEIIAAIVVYAGGSLVGWLVARSAYIAGLPLYQSIVIGVVLWFLVVLSINLISVTITRHRKTKSIATPTDSQEVMLTPQDVYLERSDDNPNTTYKRKLRVVLRNDSKKDAILYAASWHSTTGDIAVQPLQRHLWQLEGPKGWQSNSWQNERAEVHAKPGQVLQTWVALTASADETEVRRRHVTKQLGTLIVPLKIDGHNKEQTLRM